MLMVVNIVENFTKWAKQSKINCYQSGALKAVHVRNGNTMGIYRNELFSLFLCVGKLEIEVEIISFILH